MLAQNTSPMHLEPRNLPERLRWLRKQRGLTQMELGLLLCCEPSRVSSWERGLSCPSAPMLSAMAGEFGVSSYALMTGTGFQEQIARALALRAPAITRQASGPTLTLPPARRGQLMVVDTQAASEEALDPSQALAQLLRVVKQGRQAWIVVR